MGTKKITGKLDISNNISVANNLSIKTVDIGPSADNLAHLNYDTDGGWLSCDSDVSLGNKQLWVKNIHLGNVLYNQSDADYGVKVPDTYGWEDDKYIATTDQIAGLNTRVTYLETGKPILKSYETVKSYYTQDEVQNIIIVVKDTKNDALKNYTISNIAIPTNTIATWTTPDGGSSKTGTLSMTVAVSLPNELSSFSEVLYYPSAISCSYIQLRSNTTTTSTKTTSNNVKFNLTGARINTTNNTLELDITTDTATFTTTIRPGTWYTYPASDNHNYILSSDKFILSTIKPNTTAITGIFQFDFTSVLTNKSYNESKTTQTSVWTSDWAVTFELPTDPIEEITIDDIIISVTSSSGSATISSKSISDNILKVEGTTSSATTYIAVTASFDYLSSTLSTESPNYKISNIPVGAPILVYRYSD